MKSCRIYLMIRSFTFMRRYMIVCQVFFVMHVVWLNKHHTQAHNNGRSRRYCFGRKLSFGNYSRTVYFYSVTVNWLRVSQTLVNNVSVFSVSDAESLASLPSVEVESHRKLKFRDLDHLNGRIKGLLSKTILNANKRLDHK